MVWGYCRFWGFGVSKPYEMAEFTVSPSLEYELAVPMAMASCTIASIGLGFRVRFRVLGF